MEPNEFMPQDAKDVFIEAQGIINASPRAACAMLRICVERMVNAKTTQGKTLAEKMKNLDLTEKTRKIATICRLIGNDAVHGNVIDFSVGSEEARVVSQALTKFANRLADELFETQSDEFEAKIMAAKANKE